MIARFTDGKMIRGYIIDFSQYDDFLYVESDASDIQKIRIDELKAIFFVRTFEGNRGRSERKAFVWQTPPGKRVFVKFNDGEYMTGYVEGEFPWEKGFFLEPKKGKGFFLVPVDNESNNMKVFVVAESVREVTAMG
ncbi:MAG TPA: hypothetical protein VN328_10510 [Thermodesulfovibrionales bacterium]|nr:hypothetical protein [Thermodesulfovibrionales bacterium]